MANPFMIQPGNNFGQGLQALAGSVERYGDRQKAEEEQARIQKRFTDAQQAMTTAFQSGDTGQIAQVAIDYPEIQQTAKLMFGITNEQTENSAKNAYRRILTEDNPDLQLQYLDQGIEEVANFEGKPYNMIMDRVGLANPETRDETLANIRAAYAAIDPEGFKSLYGGTDEVSVAQKQYNELVDTLRPAMDSEGNLDPTRLNAEQKAAAIKLRLIPPATGSAAITAATTPGLGEQVTGFEAGKAGATSGASEQARLEVQKAMLPDIQAAIEERVQAVRRESDKLSALDKKFSDASGVKDILEMAEPLLDEATESLAGVGIDAAGKLFGFSTKGAEAAAKLKTLEGALILKMPRMEGPQSDRDQALYRQMAAQIGDATVPARIRKAAMETLKELNDKYQDQAMVIPAGIDESLWNAMTPEERAAFQ